LYLRDLKDLYGCLHAVMTVTDAVLAFLDDTENTLADDCKGV